MKVTIEELTRINKVQIEILREVSRVCKKLNIQCFMVHGSLLGTIRGAGFIPWDDDIDIAIPREQYEKFLEEAPSIIDSNYFVQSDRSDKKYPLEFAKVRDRRTTYVVENVYHLNINHGIYIDVFPIDNAQTSKWLNMQYKILSTRIGCTYRNKEECLSLKIKKMVSMILCPSFKFAVSKRKKILLSAPKNTKICITGGKPCEREIPRRWFAKMEKKSFEGIEVYIPCGYDEYLTHIYGDYKTRTLVEGKIFDNMLEINACIVDVERPYTCYIKP